MRNNLKKMKQLFFLFTTLLVVSCSSDIYEQQIEKSNKSMKMLNRSEIVKIPKLTSKLTEIKSTQNKVQERIVADTTYNFSVDTNSAIYINSGASETYTFNVLRENSNNKIENLLLIANSDGTFRTFLIKYDFTNSEKQTQGFNPLNYKSPKYTEIEADYSQLVNNRCMYRSDFICVDTYEYDRIETNSGSSASGALFYYGWRVVATNCTFVTQSSGCGGGDSNLMLTFETSPIHTSGGYGGVTVSLTSNQQTFINALNIFSSENFGIMNGDVQMSILNHVNTLTNSQINTVAYFFNYANTLWISSQSDQTQQSIINYLIANGFSTQSRGFIDELIVYLIQNQTVSWTEIHESFFSPYPEAENFIDINPNDLTYETPLTIQSLPALASFTDNFPKNGSSGNYTQMPASNVYDLVGGSLLNSYISNPNAYANACSIRGSRGLLYSNIQIPVLNYNGSQRTQKGEDLKNYILDAKSFNKFMIDKFGETTDKLEGVSANNPQQVLNFLSGKNGIYVIINNNPSLAGYTGHVDLIINGNCIGNEYLQPVGGIKSIRIWSLN